ncbi:MAG: hypothetical protein J5I65_17380 [Aridibacter famidurans]|nr:hypothetical protein [Aridibacter famidurans]
MRRSDYLIMGAALLSFLFSISLWFGVLGGDVAYNKQAAIFVGLWVPSILTAGRYFRK